MVEKPYFQKSNNVIERGEKGVQLPTRLQIDEKFFEVRRNNGSILLPQCTPFVASEAYRFLWLRNVGKNGGTAIDGGYFLQLFCSLFVPQVRLVSVYPSLIKMPRGCSQYLENEMIYYKPGYSHSMGEFFRDFTRKKYFVFTMVRDPYERAVSSYYYTLYEKMRLNSNVTIPDFGDWMRAPFGPLNPLHWSSQLACLRNSSFYDKIEFVGITGEIERDMNIIIDKINQNRDPKYPALSPYTVPESNSNVHPHPSVCSFDCGNMTCVELVQKMYPLDTSLLPFQPPSCEEEDQSSSEFEISSNKDDNEQTEK